MIFKKSIKAQAFNGSSNQSENILLTTIASMRYLIIMAVLVIFVVACHALTFKPFLRSRYSMRWTKTTEAPKHIGVILASTTPQDVSTSKTLKAYDSTVTSFINNIPSVKTSTHLPDYDYYGNNELDDSDRN
ncbi:uncharacterized protein LOC119634544 [Glossina fuscipes]|uniref:Uncharacterized protein LOC119634544 n=1 Tax=Glossina fuscipes TaxID=7396 RepID=A0A8U0WI70_9MUSC|nr:uncharacterized protein LOC119634544 [Glossina fuscipes]KAI9584713.1 hypothetical protein GQX74_006608 [Glossina fuscipes]